MSGTSQLSRTYCLRSSKGISTDPANSDKVKRWSVPTTTKEVQKFLGLASYYRRFIKDFATIAMPLHRLTTRGTVTLFTRTEACQDSFHTLKQRLVSAPVLAFPDFAAQFILVTDASRTGIGSLLSQVLDRAERVIAYANRVLTKQEWNYCVTRKELLAVFLKHFDRIYWGRSSHSEPTMAP